MLHTVKKNDGKVKIVDFEDRLKEAKNMFSPLKNIDYFKKVKTDGTTIVGSRLRLRQTMSDYGKSKP